jgi:hypothetical protein
VFTGKGRRVEKIWSIWSAYLFEVPTAVFKSLGGYELLRLVLVLAFWKCRLRCLIREEGREEAKAGREMSDKKWRTKVKAGTLETS